MSAEPFHLDCLFSDWVFNMIGFEVTKTAKKLFSNVNLASVKFWLLLNPHKFLLIPVNIRTLWPIQPLAFQVFNQSWLTSEVIKTVKCSEIQSTHLSTQRGWPILTRTSNHKWNPVEMSVWCQFIKLWENQGTMKLKLHSLKHFISFLRIYIYFISVCSAQLCMGGGFRFSSSGHQAWQQAPLPTAPFLA